MHSYSNISAPSCYLTTAVLTDCYSEVTAYTVLVYSYWASLIPQRVYMLTSRPLSISTTAAL